MKSSILIKFRKGDLRATAFVTYLTTLTTRYSHFLFWQAPTGGCYLVEIHLMEKEVDRVFLEQRAREMGAFAVSKGTHADR